MTPSVIAKVSDTTSKPKELQETPKPASNKCNFRCSRRVTLSERTMPCAACTEIFCLKHRLPEVHECKKLEELKQKKRKQLVDVLLPKKEENSKRRRTLDESDIVDGDCS